MAIRETYNREPTDRKPNVEINRSNEFTEALELSRASESGLLPRSFVSPIFVMWDITYRCPFRCLFCYNDSGTRVNRNELCEEGLLRIADDILKAQVVSVCLCGGEPFVRRAEFIKIAERLSDGGTIVNCVSNGWYITPAILAEITGIIRTIQLSLDGPDPQTHDRLRGKRGAFEQVMKAIHHISKSSFRTCELTFVPTKINYHSFPNVVELAIELGCVSRIRTQHIIQTGRGHRFDLRLNDEEEKEFEALFAQAFEQHGKEISLVFGDPWAHINDWCEGTVPPLFLQIGAQGLARISPYVPMTVGDLTKESMGLVWQRVNDNRVLIADFLRRFNTMNSYPVGRIPWIHHDLDLVADLL